METKISVLMSTYNEELTYLNQAIESILNQTLRDFEFIILLDKPENKQLQERLEYYQGIDERIKILINEKNLGLVGSLNKGLQHCKGEYIVRMDADDISDPSRFEEQLIFIENNNYDIVGGAYELFYSNSDRRKLYTFPKTHEGCLVNLRNNTCVPHPLWMVRKNVYIDLNGYREIKFCEDYDFLIRAVFKGYKLGNCPNKLLRYRYNTESVSRKNQIEQSLISSYLAENYRNSRIVTINEYKEYRNSQKYSAKEKTILNTHSKIAKFKSSQGINKIVSGLVLMTDLHFLKIRLSNILRK